MSLECPYCKGAGATSAGTTEIKDKKNGKIKTAEGVSVTPCTSCSGTGIERAHTPW